jgi:rubrerythrin
MEKTRKIDFATISLKDALDLAILIEEEAAERYEEFTQQMESYRNAEAAKFFGHMKLNEKKHGAQLAETRRKRFGDAPQSVSREMLFDVEAPEYDEARGFMTLREALDAAYRAEEKAYAFFAAALEKVQDAEVKKLFAELCEEEVEHKELVKAEIAKAPAEGKLGAEDYADGPVEQ